MKSLLNMAGSQKNKLTNLQTSLESFDVGFRSLEKDAYRLEKINLDDLEVLECLVQNRQETPEDLDNIKECLEEIKDSLVEIEALTHPCGGLGWKEVMNITYSHPGVSCPAAWTEKTMDGIKGCGRAAAAANFIGSETFSVEGMEYNEVCGRAHGYSNELPDAFNTDISGIENNYVDGLSLTHGAAGSRMHIWTFAASNVETMGEASVCPCYTGGDPSPGFVGCNYFCEAGAGDVPIGTPTEIFHSNNLLWDGAGCTIKVCCTRQTPPYFHVYLPASTTDDVEARLMFHEAGNDDVLITHVELYVRQTPTT